MLLTTFTQKFNILKLVQEPMSDPIRILHSFDVGSDIGSDLACDAMADIGNDVGFCTRSNVNIFSGE